MDRAIDFALTAPLFTDWSPQLVCLHLPGVVPGEAPGNVLSLTIDGKPAEHQFTGEVARRAGVDGAIVAVRLGLAKGEAKTLRFDRTTTSAAKPGNASGACTAAFLGEKEIDLTKPVTIGVAGRELVIPATASVPDMSPDAARGELAGATPTRASGLFASYAGFALESFVACSRALVSRRLTLVNDGPLFRDYRLVYTFAEGRTYRVSLRCHVHEPIVEVLEAIGLGMGAMLGVTFNSQHKFDTSLSHRGFEFEGDGQPVVEAIAGERPRDVFCRLQEPPLGEFVVPNNRGWFAFFNAADTKRGMLGVMGLYGGKWRRPVENVMQVHSRGGQLELTASLNGGERHWLLYAGPVETTFEPGRRFVFHRLHAEFNALRLDEHFDLTGRDVYDASCWDKPGFFGEGFRETARRNAEAIPAIKRFLAEFPADRSTAAGGVPNPGVPLRAVLEPKAEYQRALFEMLRARLHKWVAQFQGWRRGESDYAKNVIGFSRFLRGILISYELLRKDGALSDAEVRECNAMFVFAARRIMDAGRWPHEHTWQHPDHPDSTRDIYTYPGEHKPDKLVWTNCLPNFQSDPLCALAHLSALIPDHPDAERWRQFALDDLDRQLGSYCGNSGAWIESINYALYTFSYFIITFRIVKRRLGVDYFQNEHMRRYAAWLVRFFGPFDKRFGSTGWPTIGNAVLPSGGGEYMLAYASELDESDPLRAELLSVYQANESAIRLGEHYPVVTAIAAPRVDRQYPLRAQPSEVMDEVGVAMHHASRTPTESYLFQKVGFAKDHYECDETAFNWYAKGTPLCMEYGTYTGDAAVAGAHNLVEVPEQDPLRRGYLAERFFSQAVDFTRSEVPITLKLSHGKVRTFAEIDKPGKPMFFYIGDENPVGPKTWIVRSLLFVKPDYVVLHDRVFGAVPHRFNLHSVTDEIKRDPRNNAVIRGCGRYDLDLLAFVQHPREFRMETGELVPGPDRYGHGEANPHRQSFFRLYNTTDNAYRTALFAQERGRDVRIEKLGVTGVTVTTREYVDVVLLNDEPVEERGWSAGGKPVGFYGRSAWARRWSDGRVEAAVINGEWLEAFGKRFEGRGPWTCDANGKVTVEGTPRRVAVK